MPKPIDKIPGFAPTRHELCLDDGSYQVFITPPAVVGLPTVSVVLTSDQFRRYEKWRDTSVLMQDALPDVSASDREKIMTGLGDEDFKAAAAPIDGEEDV